MYLFGIQSGEFPDREQIRAGIKRAFLKGIFEDISVTVTDGENPEVFISVAERKTIETVSVEGDSVLSGRKIQRMYPLKKGQLFMCDSFDHAAAELQEKLAVSGFPRAAVSTEVRQSKEKNSLVIRLTVNTGEPDIVRKIILDGAGRDTEEILWIMQLSEGDIYDQSVLLKDIEKIRAYYKKRGYFRPVVGSYGFKDGELHIPVDSGQHLAINFEGNSAISRTNLIRETPFFEVEDFSEDIVAEAAHRIKLLYHNKGYPFVVVTPASASSDGFITTTFLIAEGPQVKVGEIAFKSIHLKEKNLKDFMLLKEGKIYNPDYVDTDRETLQYLYDSLGYLSAEVKDFETTYKEQTRTMDISVGINEGHKTIIQEVKISGTKSVDEPAVRKAINIKPGAAYNEVDISDARYRILELYNNAGFLNARVAIDRQFEGETVLVTFAVAEGSQQFFSKVIVKGNQKTQYEIIDRELLQKEGDPLNYSLVTQQRQKLYKLGLFTDITTELIDTYGNRKDTLIKVQEGKAGAVEFGIGYGDYERYRGFLELSYRNLWGMNRQVSLRLEGSSLEKRYILQYFEPWFLFLRTPLPFRAFILGEEKEEVNIDTRETRYKLSRHTVTAGVEKKISEMLKSELYYEFSVVNTYDVQPDVVLSKEDTGTLLISGMRLGLIYDTRNDPFYPSKGILSGLSVKLTSPLFLSETDFIKISFYGNSYHALRKWLVLAASLRGGMAQGYGATQELPIVERFFLGGRSTVRGYEQDTLGPKGKDGNPTGGNVFLMENLELRTLLGKGIGVVAFLDGGNVWVDITDVDLADIKFTAGLGLRYNTPVGPLRVDYGYKLQRGKGESSGEIHFSIGHAF
ncbi:MAG: outer membrane protein assembly factor BamA [Thermodesulfovibrionales bacterium]|nr:outer membrane protein assembly factor BamA [Thermodesulfovibrionales bacterium]